MSRHCLCVVSMMLMAGGCASLQTISAGHIGCPEHEIEISNDRQHWNSRSWTATCRGRDYHCIGISGGKYSTPHISCKLDRSSGVATATPAYRAPAPSGCQYDTQCKGSRICRNGRCVESGSSDRAVSHPSSSPAPPRGGPTKGGSASESRPSASDGPSAAATSELSFEQRLGVTLGEAAKHVDELGLKVNQGAVLLSVQAGGAAHRRNLRRGDVILGLAYSQVKSVADARRLGNPIQPGQSFHVAVKRGSKLFTFTMRF